MFSEAREQKRPIILDPEIAPGLYKLLYPLFTFCELIGRFEVLFAIPIKIRRPFESTANRAIILDT